MTMNIRNITKTLFIITIILSTIFIPQPSLSKPLEIEILMPAPFAESTKELIANFNKDKRRKVHINVTRGPLETESVSDLAISSLLLGKSPYDIILIDVTWLPKYAASGWLAQMDEWVETERWNSLADGAKEGNTYNEKIYRWPLVSDMGLLYWRTDLIETPPKTTMELLEQSLQLKRENKVRYGYVWQGKQYEGLSCVFLEVLNGFGGEWLDKNNKVHLNSDSSVQAAKWLKELISSGASPRSVSNFTENESLQVFKSGQSAFMRNWPYAWSELQKEDSEVKGKVGVTTMVSQTGEDQTATLGSWGFSITKSAKNKKLASEIIKYLTSESAQKYLFLNYGYTPTTSNLFENTTLKSNSPILANLKLALSKTKARPKTPLYAQLSDVLQRELSSVLSEDINPKEAMYKAQKRSEEILSSAGKLK